MTETKKESEYPEFHGIHSGKYYDRTQEENYKEKCAKMNKTVSNPEVSYDYEELILQILQEGGPCGAQSFYKRIEITEGQLYYRLKKLKDSGLIGHKDNLYFLIQKENEEKSQPKSSPDPIITCKNQFICKYFAQNKCYPEICKYFIENKK